MKKVLFLISHLVCFSLIAGAPKSCRSVQFKGKVSTRAPLNWPSNLTYLEPTMFPGDLQKALSREFKEEFLVADPGAILAIQPATKFYMGHGAFAAKEIEKNTIVGEYTGEVKDLDTLSNEFAYAMDVGNHDSCNIDAANAGNETRFVNHSALQSNIKIIKRQVFGATLPMILLISTKKICRGEELFFDYGDDYWYSVFRHLLKNSENLKRQLRDLFPAITPMIAIEFAQNIYLNFYKSEDFSGTPLECFQDILKDQDFVLDILRKLENLCKNVQDDKGEYKKWFENKE